MQLTNYIEDARQKAWDMLGRYYGCTDGFGMSACPFAFGHWFGIKFSELEPNSVGMELCLHDNSECGRVIEYSKRIPNLDECIAYCLGHYVLGHMSIQDVEPKGVYNWGSPSFSPLEVEMASVFAREILGGSYED